MELNKIKEYQAIRRDKQGKPKTIFIIYTATKKEEKYHFCLFLPEYEAFMNDRGHQLRSLIKNAIIENSQSQYFEYTGSHFEPVVNPKWKLLEWERE